MPAAKGDFSNDQRITLRKPPDARTPELARRYAMLRNGMTVQEALQALTARGLRGRGRRRSIRDMIERGFIAVITEPANLTSQSRRCESMAHPNAFDRITFDPKIMGGRACIRGMRIPVSVIVGQIAGGASPEQILADYPDLDREDIRQALAYAAWLAREEVIPA
jgi:uncharacterized protein (DUF433 family)